MNEHDEQLARAFKALREDEVRRTPPFARVMAAASTRRSRVRPWAWALGLATLGGALLLVFGPPSPAPREFDGAQALVAFEGPSSALLEPGSELTRAWPTLVPSVPEYRMEAAVGAEEGGAP